MNSNNLNFNNTIFANITWNPFGWKNTYINPKAGHKYARENPGHESLNFKFDKNNIDDDKYVYGYVQWKYKPVHFADLGTIIFYTVNNDIRKGQIVGIYGKASILREKIKMKYKGFQNDELNLNIKAEKDYSMLFPIPLIAKNYRGSSSKRMVGEIGFAYSNISVAINIIYDELIQIAKLEEYKNEYNKLINIYFSLTGKEFIQKTLDESEQNQLENILISNYSIRDIISELNNLKKTDPEKLTINHIVYKRDNKTIVQLKILRKFKCQICNTSIPKKNGNLYIEAAHIIPKSHKGCETPDNILILCPNHHKEFDYGKREIKEHTNEYILFDLNNNSYKINLKLKQ